MKGKFGKTSRSLKILWPRLSEKFSFAFYVFIKCSNFWKQSISLWNLLYLSKKGPISNFKGFQYQTWTSVKRLEKLLSSKTSFLTFLEIRYSMLKALELPKLWNKSSLQGPGVRSKQLFSETILATIYETNFSVGMK